MAQRIAVIGAGVMGLTSAVLAIEQAQEDVEFTLIAEKFSPDTTGDGSAGYWAPYLLGDVPMDVLRYWCEKTATFCEEIYKTPQASDYGISLVTCFKLLTSRVEEPPYKDLFIDYRPMTEKELSLFPEEFKYGFAITTYIIECKKLLPMLLKRFKNKGGKVIQKKVNKLEELAGSYDIVINCSGLGAKELVSDPAMKPVRGQLIYVKAPWIKHAVTCKDFYIHLHADVVVCGGTSQVNDWNLTVDPKDRLRIWEGCKRMLPSLTKAEVVSEWVGLRPSRDTPRLERETVKTEHGDLQVVHNYGHGGSGVTLCWGCACHVLRLLHEILPSIKEC